MKRWIWILAMAPVMWGLLQMVIWADRLHAWQYSPDHAPPTKVDFTRAAVVFWSALLVPFCTGMVAAVIAFRGRCSPRWPSLETAVIAIPYVAIIGGSLTGVLNHTNMAGQICWQAIMWAYLFVGGALVTCLLNLGACARQRCWWRFTLSAFVAAAGLLYLVWFNAFILYIDT